MTWRAIGSVLPTQLGGARVELHWAAQLLSAPGASLLPAETDCSQTNLRWDPGLEVLLGHCGVTVRARSLASEQQDADPGRDRDHLRPTGERRPVVLVGPIVRHHVQE